MIENPFENVNPDNVDNELEEERRYLPHDGKFLLNNLEAELLNSEDPNKPGVSYFIIRGTLTENLDGNPGIVGATYGIAIETPRLSMPEWKSKRMKTLLLHLFCAAFGKSPDVADNRSKAVIGMQRLEGKLYDELSETLSGGSLVVITKGRVAKKGERAGETFSDVIKFLPAG